MSDNMSDKRYIASLIFFAAMVIMILSFIERMING